MDLPLTRSSPDLVRGELLPLNVRGRNRISATSIGDGRRLHVKHFVGDGAAERYRTTVVFDEWVRRRSPEHLRPARVVQHTSAPPSVSTEWVPGAPLDYKTLVTGTPAGQSESRVLGNALSLALAELHDQAPPDVFGEAPARPSIQERICRATSHLSVEAYTRSSAGALALWATVHRDRVLVEAIGGVAERVRRREHVVPTHADLRLDQILWDPTSRTVTIVDWEEFRVDDPSLDLGSLLGDLLFAGFIESLGAIDPATGGNRESTADVHQATQECVSAVRPVTNFVWATYANNRLGRLPRVEHVAQAIGLHLLDRVLAHATASHELSVLMRSTLGISRVALLTPSVIVTALDLERP